MKVTTTAEIEALSAELKLKNELLEKILEKYAHLDSLEQYVRSDDELINISPESIRKP